MQWNEKSFVAAIVIFIIFKIDVNATILTKC